MNRQGRWVAENPGAEVVSFYLWAAYSPLESWANIAKAWLRAKGNAEADRQIAAARGERVALIRISSSKGL